MNILLTGGAGYIGSNVAQSLIDEDNQVTIVDNLITGNLKFIPSKANFLNTDISNEQQITKLLKKDKFDLVMHFAGYVKVDESFKDPEKYFLNNFEKTKLFVDFCLNFGLNKFIFSSTAGIYGKVKTNKKVDELDKLDPSNPYALSKLKVEEFLLSRKEIKSVILRYFNVAGADKKLNSGLMVKNSNNLIKVICEVATNKKQKLIVNGGDYKTKDGTAVRDFIHISDLSDMHIIIADYLKSGGDSEIYNCGYGEGYSIKEVIVEMEKILQSNLNYEIGPRREGDIPFSVANCDKFKNKFNWNPKYNNLNYILNSALNWEKKIDEH